MRKVAPEPGAYVSESNFFQADWQRAYWGANYERLRAIKAQYDPEGLFFRPSRGRQRRLEWRWL